MSPLIDMNLSEVANELMPGIKFVNGKAVLEKKPDTKKERLPVKLKDNSVDEEGVLKVDFN